MPTTPAGSGFARAARASPSLLDQRPLAGYRVDSAASRSFYPLIGPTGDPYTRAFPMHMVPGEDHDHPHQRSCWFTHGKVNGIDFWSEGGKCGKIKETNASWSVEGLVLARLATRMTGSGPTADESAATNARVTFYRTRESRIIDFEFTIHASDGPVTFGDTKEGMFGIRVASSMDVTRKDGGRITNAEGLVDEKAWGKASSVGRLRRPGATRRRSASPCSITPTAFATRPPGTCGPTVSSPPIPSAGTTSASPNAAITRLPERQIDRRSATASSCTRVTPKPPGSTGRSQRMPSRRPSRSSKGDPSPGPCGVPASQLDPSQPRLTRN